MTLHKELILHTFNMASFVCLKNILIKGKPNSEEGVMSRVIFLCAVVFMIEWHLSG